MATYKFITITEQDGDHLIRNIKSGNLLGMIEWYPTWRQWVFVADSSAVWSRSCLNDVAEYMRLLKANPPTPPEEK